nr:MAG TPA: D-amino acid oxidase [Caudoviricetes sp.]
METFVTIVFTLMLFSLIAFVTVVNAIAKILGNGAWKTIGGGVVGFLIAKFLEKRNVDVNKWKNDINNWKNN